MTKFVYHVNYFSMNRTVISSYSSPTVVTIDIEVEHAFADSATDYLDYKQNPSMPYGDDGEEWF